MVLIPPQSSAPHRIGFIFVEGFALMSAAAAIEPLRAANLLAGKALYELTLLSMNGSSVRASVGAMFETVPVARAGNANDLIFVVAGGEQLRAADARLIGYLRRLAAYGVPLGGISGGAAILAEAGLMEGRRFTVHWKHFDELRARGEAHLLERKLFIIDRDRYSCAGGIASLDMTHALISRHYGAKFARKVSDWFIHTQIRLAEAPQQSSPAARFAVNNPDIAAAIELMESHIADPLSLDQLANLVGLGSRQLERLFANAFGLGVIRFYRNLRLGAASGLLADTALPIKAIADATGFVNVSHFSQCFKGFAGCSPRAYRRRDCES